MIEALYNIMTSKLCFDPDTGDIWRKGRSKATAAGTVSERGYRCIGVDNKVYRAHRLMWLYVYQEWPAELDHVNCDKLDNRIVNLRKATQQQNKCNRLRQSNNTSGFKGVHFHRVNGKWVSRIGHNGKRIILGGFDTPEEAYAIYCVAAQQLHGKFARVE